MRRLSTTLALLAGGAVAVALAGAPAHAAPAIGSPAAAADTAVGTYYPITKDQRILDTRSTVGGHKAPLGPNGELTLQAGGVAGVPAGAAASAVVVNLTAVSPTAATYLTAYPSGASRPTVSSINLAAKTVRANLVTVPLGADGTLRIYNNSGSVNVIVDVMGFFAGTDVQGTYGVGNQFAPVDPERVFDSRSDTGEPLAPGDGYILGLDFGAQNADVRGYAINITAIKPSGAGYLVAWDGSDPMPTASSINFRAGQVVPNMAFVASQTDTTDPSGTQVFVLANNSTVASTHVAVDVVGVFTDNQSEGFRFHPLAPERVVDTRSGLGGVKAPIGANQTRTYAAPGSVAGDQTGFLVGNATAIAPTVATYLTISEGGLPRPPVSNLNVAAGEVAANAAIVPLGEGNLYNVYNNAGSVNLALDVSGAFDFHTVAPAAPVAGLAESRAPLSSDTLHGTPRIARR